MVDRKHRDFTEDDIQKLADTFEAFQDGNLEDVKGFCSVADLQEIEKQDFILTPGRYVGIVLLFILTDKPKSNWNCYTVKQLCRQSHNSFHKVILNNSLSYLP